MNADDVDIRWQQFTDPSGTVDEMKGLVNKKHLYSLYRIVEEREYWRVYIESSDSLLGTFKTLREAKRQCRMHYAGATK